MEVPRSLGRPSFAAISKAAPIHPSSTLRRRGLQVVALAALVAACEPPGEAASPTVASAAVTAEASPAAAPANATRVVVAKSSDAALASKPALATAFDAQFADFASKTLHAYLKRAPDEATEVGEHAFDATWPDVSADGDAALLNWVAETRTKLVSFPREQLGKQNRIDASILAARLDAIEFSVRELKEYETSPVRYTKLIGDGLDPLLTRQFAPASERMKSVRGRLLGIPVLVATAMGRLAEPAKIETQTAIEQNAGLIALCEKGLQGALVATPDQRADVEAAAKIAAVALREFQRFMEKDLLPRSIGSLRVGRARFEKILGFALEDDVSADALVRDARAVMTETQEQMFETARDLWPSRMKGPMPAADSPLAKKAIVRKVLDQLADDRPDDTTIVAESRRVLAEATEFVSRNDLVGVPTETCNVREMPEYRRGVAVAYCDSTGPLEKKQETVFAISPTPRDWSKPRALSFYREYNRSMLADLTVHEAMPGHFLQAMHANHFHSDVRAVFSNGAFVEGWAVYAEWLMAHHGFGGPNVRMQRLKMVLRAATNAVLDYGVHVENLEEKEALDLMKNEAFQEEGEAVGKWKRARLSKGQLSTYFYGFREFMKLRHAAEEKPGFSGRAFHDKLLSFGSPAMRYLRELMVEPAPTKAEPARAEAAEPNVPVATAGEDL